MPVFGPVSRRKLVAFLRELGFEGPLSGGKHEYMVRGAVTVRVPNPHRADVGTDLLKRVLRQAGVSRLEWEEL